MACKSNQSRGICRTLLLPEVPDDDASFFGQHVIESVDISQRLVPSSPGHPLQAKGWSQQATFHRNMHSLRTCSPRTHSALMPVKECCHRRGSPSQAKLVATAARMLTLKRLQFKRAHVSSSHG